MKYYGMNGEEISLEEWSDLYRNGPAGDDKRRVAETTLPDGKWVSTVLLGMDHGWGMTPHRPVIFETMVFPSRNDLSDLDMDRYCTKEEALEGHARMVAKWSSKTELAEAMEKRKPGKWGDE